MYGGSPVFLSCYFLNFCSIVIYSIELKDRRIAKPYIFGTLLSLLIELSCNSWLLLF